MNIRKYIAEFIGTIMLVTIGCGTAVGSTALTGALGLEGSPLVGGALAALVRRFVLTASEQ